MPYWTTKPNTILLIVVALMSISSFFPPTCVKQYQEFLQWSDTWFKNDKAGLLSFSSSVYLEASKLHNRTSNVDIGWQAQIDNGYPLQPVSEILPKRLFVIYGLESSGTTFTAKTIAQAVGIDPSGQGDRMESLDGETQVHHISLPWGLVAPGNWGFHTKFSQPLPMIPVFYPKKCEIHPMPGLTPPALRPTPPSCRDIMGDQDMTRPHRFFVNMTANVQWYRQRGVRVYPIMVVRDPMLHFQGIVKARGGHCPNATAAYRQYEQGRAIMVETIEKGIDPLLVSYEAMLTLQRPYLEQLYREMGINSTYNPGFRNGNTKYVSTTAATRPYVETALLKEDAPPPRRTFPSNKLPNGAALPKRMAHPRGTTIRGATSSNGNTYAKVNPLPDAGSQKPKADDAINRAVQSSAQYSAAYRDQLERMQTMQALRAKQQQERNAKAALPNNAGSSSFQG